MTKYILKIWNAIVVVLAVIVLVLALLLAGVRLIGLQPFAVLSDSMEPAYHAGSLIYVQDVDYRALDVGDIITFMVSEDAVVTRRIVGVIPDKEDSAVLRYRTKGDASDAEDGTLVHYKNILGIPVFAIPYLGYLAHIVQHPPGMYIAIFCGIILMLLAVIPNLPGRKQKSKTAARKGKGGKYLRQ